jgi:hypothetical protein
MPESTTNTPENGMKPTIKNTEDCIETLQQFEDCLPQNDSQQEESQLDNLTHKLVQQHYKFHPQWMAKSGILPPRLATCRVPQCVACYNDNASRLIWQEKGSARIAVDPLTMKWQFGDGLPHKNSQQESPDWTI